MSATLYELVLGERGALSELLEETEGELTPEIESLLAELDLKIDAKLESVGLYILSQTTNAASLKEEEARLAARRKALERGVAGLKGYAERMMREAGKDKVKGLRCTVALQMNPPHVIAPEWDDEALRGMAMVTPQFVTRVPESFALNKRAILDAVKAGEQVPDGVTIERTASLRVR